MHNQSSDRHWVERRVAVMPPPGNLPYVVAIVIMAGLAITAVAAIAILRPGTDNSALYLTIATFVTPTTLSLLAFMKSHDTGKAVNGRLEEFLNARSVAAHAQGLAEGRAQGRLESNARTDALAAGGVTLVLAPGAATGPPPRPGGP